jgi:hypothetical protein
VGAFIDPESKQQSFNDLAVPVQNLLTRYAQRVPSTDELFGYLGEQALTGTAAVEHLDGLVFRTDELEFADAEERVWSYNDEPRRTYTTKVATLRCTFARSALLEASGDSTAFSAPDLIAGVADLADSGPIRIDYDFQVENNAAYGRTAVAFVSAKEYVDEATADRIVSFSEDFWHRNTSGTRAILISGGTATFEPAAAPMNRVVARLAAAFFASFAIALAVIVLRRSINHVRFLN